MSCLVCGRPETVAPFVAQHQYGGGVCQGCKEAPAAALAALRLLESAIFRSSHRTKPLVRYTLGESDYEIVHRHIQKAAHSLLAIELGTFPMIPREPP